MKKLLVVVVVFTSSIFIIGGFSKSFAATIYYVSFSGGNDSYAGTSTDKPFKTMTKVNGLNLTAGDQVLFQCGDTWQGVELHITKSGVSGNPIVYGSYPTGNCSNKPIISGSLPITGWSQHAGNIYKAILSSTTFPNGINQLFRSGVRLMMGRWPNMNAANGGYSFVDAQPAGNQISDAQLPAVNWNGGVVHLMGMRWYILNREITATTGTTLTLGANADCWGDCASNGGWGYFINNHLNTLDQDGEWHYDTGTRTVYLYSASGTPTNIEGSVVLYDDDRYRGGITLGRDLDEEIAYVTIDNFIIKNWFRNGISTPTNYAHYELHDVIIRNNHVRDVDDTGLKFAVWVYESKDGRPDGWRGGYNLTVQNNLIDGANHFGMDLYSRNSAFIGNTIQNIGLLKNLNKSGIGCSYTDGEGQCTEPGDGVRVKVDEAADSGNTNLIQRNRLIKIGYNGMDIFGFGNTLRQNYIQEACSTKADCGGIRTFGGSSLSNTNAYNITLDQNIIIDPVGNVDGANNTYNQEHFAFGLYIDHYSKNVTAADNTIIRAPSSGVIYPYSTGSLTGNTAYDCSRNYGRELFSFSDTSQITTFSGNIMYAIGANARTLSAHSADTITTSDSNYFFHPFRAQQIYAGGSHRTFGGWQTYSGKDAHSKKHWFTQNVGEESRSEIFYNNTGAAKTFDLGATSYKDLDQNNVNGSLTLQPFTSRILIIQGYGSYLLWTR